MAKWEPLAALRTAGLPWDGSGYVQTRHQTLDEESISQYYEGLRPLLEIAPTGFPAHKNLSDTMALLHAKHHIFSHITDARCIPRACAMAADSWRVMAKLIYNAATDKKQWQGQLSALAAMIQLPAASSTKKL